MIAAKSKRRGSSRIIWILAVFVGVFVLWAKNAPLDEIVRGPGVIVPASKNQIVQSLEGGILEDIVVQEGDIVEAGQVIARLNQTRFQADVRDFESQILSTQARIQRVNRELEGADDFTLPDRFWEQDAALADSEERLFTARRFQYTTSLASAEERYELQSQQVALMQDMVNQNAMPALELITAQTQQSEAQERLNNIRSEYQLGLTDELSTLLGENARLEAQIAQSRDQLQRATLMAPAYGVVNTLYFTTIGSVVQPGEPIFEITPLNEELLVEVRIPPKDIAFIAPGMSATIKLSAYDYTVYGSLRGVVTQVSADTFEDAQAANSEPYYKVLLSVLPESLADSPDITEIRPGMLSDAELHVGEKTVLQYLLTPLIRTSTALTEP